MSWMSKAFGGGSSYSNPADAAMPYLEEVPGYVDEYYNPYITMGQTAGNTAQGQYQKMATDPAAFANELMASYEPSEWYNYQSDQMTDQAAASAAAGGFTGTEQDMQNQNEMIQGLSSKDMQTWMNYVMQLLGGGLQGEQAMYNTGYNASNQAADAMIGNANAQAGLAYKGQSNENAYNQSQSNAFMNALGDTAGAAAYYFR